MQASGKRLRDARERLRLKYRDVEQASQWIANQHGNHSFLVGISRLADIENKGTIPSIYRLYSLCVIYQLEYAMALQWYGIDVNHLTADAAHFGARHTQTFDLPVSDQTLIDFPLTVRQEFDFSRTDHLSRSIKEWSKLPLTLLRGMDLEKGRYAFIGTEDWSMFPLISPGSFIQLDERKKRIARDGWTSEFERPIYFLAHRSGFKCGWCSQAGKFLIVQPHSSSTEPASIYQFPGEVEIVGQVTAVLTRLDLGKKRHTHS